MKYAICGLCKKEKEPGIGCTAEYVMINGANVRRLRFGKDGCSASGNWCDNVQPINCSSCNTPPNGYHHADCDMEKCPNCGGQLIKCTCVKSVG